MWSCSDDATDSETSWSAAQVETMAPVSVSLENAVLQGRSYHKSETIIQRGFLFSISPIDLEQAANGDIDTDNVSQIEIEGNEDGVFTATLQNLEIGTTCYYAAYIILADGTWRVGMQRDFNPDYLDVLAATPPLAGVTVDSYKAATVVLELRNFGTDNLQGLEPQMFKVYDVGVYSWKEGEGSLETALKTPYNATEAEMNALAEGQTVNLLLTGLRGETTYHCVPYVQIGIYRPYAEYVYLMPEVVGEATTFTTEPTPAADVQTLTATSVVIRGGTLNGKLISDAGDENARFGFCFSNDESDLEEHKYEVTAIDDEGLFFYAIDGLEFNKTYYYKTYVSVREGEPDAETAYGATMEFTTEDLSIPVLEVAMMNYAYRIENVTQTSAVVTCLLTNGIDSSLNLSTCKVNYGIAPELLTDEAVTQNTELVDGNTFTVTITGLTPGTQYYFKPSATNEKGCSAYDKVNSFRTPVSTREYLFDPTITAEGDNVYVLNRMSTMLADCTDLIYHELDPIEGVKATYYLLDRNLNSRAPFEQADTSEELKGKDQTLDLWKKVGGLYTWGFEKPSYTWNLPALTKLNADNGAWVKWADPNPIKKTGMTWPLNPCPKGYDIPTKAQYEEMVKIAGGSEFADATLASVFHAMRMGPTSGQRGDNGNTNEGPKAALMHIKDGCVDANGQVGIVRIGHGRTGNAKTETSIGTYSRTNSLAIRCVRVKEK